MKPSAKNTRHRLSQINLVELQRANSQRSLKLPSTIKWAMPNGQPEPIR
jgi:hypothetical protein